MLELIVYGLRAFSSKEGISLLDLFFPAFGRVMVYY